MSNRTTDHSLSEKVEIVTCIIEKGYSLNHTAKEYQVGKTTIESWVRKYKLNGQEGLKESRTWKKYTETVKIQAVEDYLHTSISQEKVCEKYGISDRSVLRKWINLYTSGKEFKSTSKGRSKRMNKGRKTTWKERIEIAQYAIAHGKDYQKTQEKYNVSYQQVYGWVRKYEKDGESALQDRRGRTLKSKPEETLTEEEKLQLRVKELEERAKYLEMENGLLKKLKEIERRDRHQ